MLSNYPQPEVRVFGERVASALMDANIRNSMNGLGGCKAFDMSDFDEDTHPYIQAYLEGNHDSLAVIYAAMRTLDKQLKKRKAVPATTTDPLLRRISQAEFDSFPVVDGVRLCPLGNYYSLRVFSTPCRFEAGSMFGRASYFGKGTIFGSGCTFSTYCKFGPDTTFGDNCKFGDFCYFEQRTLFGVCYFGARCKFMESTFSPRSHFGPGCKFLKEVGTGVTR